VALAFDVVFEAKRDAGPNREGLIYACPDLSKHGQAYADVAELYVVRGIQELLF
jgi:hypothetical protein